MSEVKLSESHKTRFFCEDADLPSHYFWTKGKTLYFLKSLLAYKFVYAKCNSCYIGITCRYFKNRIGEQVKKDKKCKIYKYLDRSWECSSSINWDRFSVLDYTPIQFQIKIKEGMYIDWEKPNLNKQLNHLATTLCI